MPNLLHQYTAYKLLINPTAASSADLTGSTIDTAGYDGCEFTAIIGDAAGSATSTLAIYTSASTTGLVAISGATAVTTGGADNKLLVVDICKPRKRYLQPRLDLSTTADTLIGGVVARLYRGRNLATTASTTGALGAAKVFLVNPNT